MSCGGGHLGFPIGIKNSNLVKDIPMIIHLQFGFSQFISFREDLWNFSQSEHIIGPGSHVEYPTGTKNSNFVEDHPRNIPAKFGSNWPSGFGEEAWNVKSLQTTDDGRQVMAIVYMDLWSRWTKNGGNIEFQNQNQNQNSKRSNKGTCNQWFGIMVFNPTFNNILVISWRSVVEETRVPGENHRPALSHWLCW
jgi:hypothetical protein